MRKSPYYHPRVYRNDYHLSLKDVAFLLQMDESNLSRFEAGKTPNSKAQLGYHFLFNLSIDICIRQVFAHTREELLHRCFSLLEILQAKSPTQKVRKRMEGVERIIKQLSQTEEEYADH